MSSIAMGTISWVSRCPLCTLQLCCSLISSCHQDFAAIILGEEVGVNIENNIENNNSYNKHRVTYIYTEDTGSHFHILLLYITYTLYVSTYYTCPHTT